VPERLEARPKIISRVPVDDNYREKHGRPIASRYDESQSWKGPQTRTRSTPALAELADANRESNYLILRAFYHSLPSALITKRCGGQGPGVWSSLPAFVRILTERALSPITIMTPIVRVARCLDCFT
jgi:hypothetical protein